MDEHWCDSCYSMHYAGQVDHSTVIQNEWYGEDLKSQVTRLIDGGVRPIFDTLMRIQELLEAVSYPVLKCDKDGKYFIEDKERNIRVNVENAVEVTGSVTSYDPR